MGGQRVGAAERGVGGAVQERDDAGGGELATAGVGVDGGEDGGWAMFSRSPATLPGTSLPKMLWPLLRVIMPTMSESAEATEYVVWIADDNAIRNIELSSRQKYLLHRPHRRMGLDAKFGYVLCYFELKLLHFLSNR